MRDGLLVGRWKMSDFFNMLGTLEAAGMNLCTDNPLYPIVKQGACQYVDMASTLGGATTPCDSMSFAMAFDADPALLGRIWPPPSATSTCLPNTDPSNDTCDGADGG